MKANGSKALWKVWDPWSVQMAIHTKAVGVNLGMMAWGHLVKLMVISITECAKWEKQMEGVLSRTLMERHTKAPGRTISVGVEVYASFLMVAPTKVRPFFFKFPEYSSC